MTNHVTFVSLPPEYSNVQFSEFNKVSSDVLSERKELMSEYLDQSLQRLSSHGVVMIADFGTADGGNAIEVLNYLVGFTKSRRGSDQEVVIVLEDQSSNDFNSLMNNIYGKSDGERIVSHDNVYVQVTGKDKFQVCIPKNTLNFGFSIAAAMYLSKRPCNIRDGIFTHLGDKDETKLVSSQADEDWKSFIIARGKELKPGGAFLVIIPSYKEMSSTRPLTWREISDVYKEMVKDGKLTLEEFINTNFDLCLNRTTQDMMKPFQDQDILKMGLNCIFCKRFKKEMLPAIAKRTENNMDYSETCLHEHAKTIIGIMKSWMFTSMYSGLKESRTTSERINIIDEYFERLLNRILHEEPYNPFIAEYIEVLIRKEIPTEHGK